MRRRVNASPTHLELITSALRGVVAESRGTAHASNIPEVEIAGKTGTAQVSRISHRGEDAKRAVFAARDHAWFAAVAPARNPEIAMVVLVEHGGSGGHEAAPIVAQVVREYFLRIRPGEPIPSVHTLRDEQERSAAHQRARNRVVH